MQPSGLHRARDETEGLYLEELGQRGRAALSLPASLGMGPVGSQGEPDDVGARDRGRSVYSLKMELGEEERPQHVVRCRAGNKAGQWEWIWRS